VPLLSDHNIAAADRATLIKNNGGVVNYNIDDAAVLGNGWFVYLINAGSGAMTIHPFSPQTVDGSATKVINPGESCILFSDGTNLETVGYGRSLVNSVTGVSIPTAPGGTLNLTSPQISAQVQNWVGTLTANSILDYGGGVGYWFVYNNTTGAFTTTARTNSLDPGVVVPQGHFSIIRSDGTNMNVAFTATSGTVTEIDTQAGELVGGPLTSTGTIGLANTGVVAGVYGDITDTPPTMASIQIDLKGRAVVANNQIIGTAVQHDAGTAVGNVPLLVANMGTTPAGTPGLVPPQSGGVPTGTTLDFMLATLPAGYIWAVGSIGNTGSGGSALVGPTAHDLFVGIWNSYPNTTAPVAPGGRGTDAETDWNANKNISVGDFRGRTKVARDAMGTFGAAGVITNATAYPDGVTLGAYGGVQLLSGVGLSASSSGGISGSTYGTLGGGGSTGTEGSDSFANSGNGGSFNFPSIGHTHNFSVTVGGTLGVTGSYSGSGRGTVDNFEITQPFHIVNVIIKL
jgi:hypothetical protein